MSKSLRSTAFITIGVVLISAAAFLTGFNVAEDQNAGTASNEVVAMVSQIANDRKAIWEEPDEDVIPDYLLNPDMEMPTIEKDGVDYIGVIELPNQGIKLGVASELQMYSLKRTPCRYDGSIYDDSCIIAGHNYRSHVWNLNYVQIGDPVTFTDADGTVFEYQVSAIEEIDGQDEDAMKAGDWDLTMFTCTLTRTERLTIRCERTDRGGIAM